MNFMGLWHTTCGVTQLPIRHGDNVRLFILIGKHYYFKDCAPIIYGGGICLPNDIWQPIGPAIKGTYNNYGGIENIIENQDTEILLKLVKKELVICDNDFAKASAIEKMSLSEVLSWIEQDKAKSTLYSNGSQNMLGLMMILEDVYQAMISFKPITSNISLFKSYKLEFKKWYISLSNLHLHHTMEISYYDLLYIKCIDFYKEKLQECVKNKLLFNNKEVQRICNSAIELLSFSDAMHMARKIWQPQSGKGCQHEDLDIYKKIIKVTNKIIKNRVK
jgi:hypothetical protein